MPAATRLPEKGFRDRSLVGRWHCRTSQKRSIPNFGVLPLDAG